MPIGYWDNDQSCYIDSSTSQCTSLDATGSGDYSGLTYYNGDPAQGFYSSIPSSSYTNTYFISGVATALDSSGNGYWGGWYYVSATQTTLDASGNGSWNGAWYWGGVLSTELDASGTGYQGASYGMFSSGYYYLGGLTSLGSSGTGYWSGNTYASGYVSGYFIAGVLTMLDSCGNGSWNGSNYVDGTVSNSAWSSCANVWYFNGLTESGVDQNGNGWSWSSNQYFLGGAQTTLDYSGNGTWNGLPYYGGTAQPTGWNGYSYWITNLETTLDSSGSGTWNGGTYVNGVLQTYGVTFAGSVSGDGDWANVANWLDANGGGAALLPDGSSAVTIIANVTQCSSGQPAILPSMVVDGASLGISVMVTPGLAVFKNGASLQSSLDGSAAFYDTSFMSMATVVGNATFYGNSSNRNGIGGTTTAAHGGGINGSNILGFA